MANSLDDVIRQMARYGIDVPAKVDLAGAFKRYVRWRPSSEKKAKKTAWARLHEWRSPSSNRVYVFGWFGIRGDKWEVEASTTDWTPAERAAWLEQRKAAEKAAQLERQQEAETAAEKARRLWKQGRDEGASEYLQRKKVGAYGIRFGFNSRLMVPLRDVEGALHGIQWISPDGAKIFGTGTMKEGRFHLIGEVQPTLPLAFAEGYATGATVHMATGWPVIVCFDAGNLEPVVSQWRKLYPELQMVMAADDDRHLLERLCARLANHGIAATPAELAKLDQEYEWTVPGVAGAPDTLVILKAGWSKDAAGVPCIVGTLLVSGGISGSVELGVDAAGQKISLGVPTGGTTDPIKLENAGRSRAEICAKRYKARVLLPPFRDQAGPGTDWNDLHVAEGLDVCREALLRLLQEEPPAKNRADGRPPGGGKKGPPEGGDDGQYNDFLNRYTLLYGTTTVWDAQVRQVLRIESLKLAYGKLVDWWLSHEKRRMVPQDHLVFDPTGRCKPPEYVNLFAGLPLKPDPGGSCKRIVEHLFQLCQENEDLFHWVACWLALPLQRLGTKMHTAVVLHGRTEGTGKSLFASIMKRIYGVHSRSINQRQLETEFNGWISGMMFIVAEEVVSRQDRSHLQGILQDMITGETVNINEKNLPLRTEANFANFMMFSNQQVPVILNKTDRRHTVIKVEREHPDEYFDALLAEIDNGGVESFYHWLMTYPVGDFTRKTKPYRNKDRLHLITLGLSPDQRFFQYWEAGVAGVPFVTCPASDLYLAFKAWCKVSGERFVPNNTAFGRTISEELERLQAPEKKKVRYWAYSDKAVIDGDWNAELVQHQGIVYFVHSAIERRGLGGDDPDAPAAQAPPAVEEDVTASEMRDKRIKLFQASLHTLVASARRTL